MVSLETRCALERKQNMSLEIQPFSSPLSSFSVRSRLHSSAGKVASFRIPRDYPRAQSLLSLLAGVPLIQGKAGSGDKWFDWAKFLD